METMIKILGMFFLFCIGIFIICVGCAMFADATKATLRRAIEEARSNMRHEIAYRLKQDSYWFSESPDAEHAIRLIADTVNLRKDIDQCRNEWRKLINKE